MKQKKRQLSTSSLESTSPIGPSPSVEVSTAAIALVGLSPQSGEAVVLPDHSQHHHHHHNTSQDPPPQYFPVESMLDPVGLGDHTDTAASADTMPSPLSVLPGYSVHLRHWHDLSAALSLCSKTPLLGMIDRCISLFFAYLYPLTPLVHEASIREDLALLADVVVANAGSPSQSSSTGGSTIQPPGQPAAGLRWSPKFTLVTAVCAETAYMLPQDLFPDGGDRVADVFLQASRACLQGYVDDDLEQPDAASITIRYFHSNCLHAAGRLVQSWHIFGEAVRLVQVMRLHEEAAFEGLPVLEAELRRRAFWIVYMGDKSAALLNGRPVTIHRFSFEAGITTKYPGQAALVAGSPNTMAAQRILDGFNANLRLWQLAADILLDIRMFRERDADGGDGADGNYKDGLLALALRAGGGLQDAEARRHMHRLYVRFVTYLDQMTVYTPLDGSSPGTTASSGSAAAAPPSAATAISGDLVQGSLATTDFPEALAPSIPTTPEAQFIIQTVNVRATFHCLRMVLTQALDDLGLFATDFGNEADLKVTEIARDMLRLLHDAPFWSLQVNGEPFVEKLRLIGASLLALMHRNDDEPLTNRARNDFLVLLNVLARLDSKASDALKAGTTQTF